MFYSSVVASLMGTFFYLSLVPSIILVEVLLLFFLLIAARRLLFKTCKRPKQFTSLLNRSVNKLSQLCIIMFWAGRVVFKIMLADSGNFPNRMAAMWRNLYFKIEVAIVGVFVVLVYLLSWDEWLGRKLHERRQRNSESLLAGHGGTMIDLNYENAHSFIGLVETSNSDIDMTYEQQGTQQAEMSYPAFE